MADCVQRPFHPVRSMVVLLPIVCLYALMLIGRGADVVGQWLREWAREDL